MRHKSGTAFLNALSVQRRRAQQGFQIHLHSADMQNVSADTGNAPADIGEVSVLMEGPSGEAGPLIR